MNKPVLVVMAAGMGSRYGGLKQIDPVGNHGQMIIDYAIYDALQNIDNLSEIAAMDYAERHEALCDALIAAFTAEDFSIDGLTGSGMSWSTAGEISKDPVVVVIENGAYVTM